MSHKVHILWGSIAAGLYRAGILDASVRLAHAEYDFRSPAEAQAFLRGVSAARRFEEWAHVQDPGHISTLGPPLDRVLSDAVKSGDVRTVVHLLRIGVDPNKLGVEGVAPIHVACGEGHHEVVAALIEFGADRNVSTACARRQSAAHLCAEHASYGHRRSLSLLIEAGARLTDVDADGNTALHVAAAHANAEAVHLLLAEDIDVSETNRYGATALEVAGKPWMLRGDSDGGGLGVDAGALDVTQKALEAALERAGRDDAVSKTIRQRARPHFNNFGFAR